MSKMPEWGEGHGHAATCPYCGESWEDLWDYDWRSREIIEEDCPYCEKPILLLMEIDATYYTAKDTERGTEE